MIDAKAVRQPTRRSVVAIAGLGGLAAALAPRLARADAAAVDAAIKKLYGDKQPAQGKIKLDLPQIAENGNTVPLTVTVESPMTAEDHVKAVHVWADGNPLPGLASFYFTPAAAKAIASTRLRLARTQNIVAIAETSKGELFSVKTEVKVTIGGCGG
jgi:sulfur-oxidizing protein SoxY